MAEPPGRTRRVTVKRYNSAQEADRHDLEYWLQLSEAERIIQTWRLSVEQWSLRGGAPDEPGLCRLLRAFVAAEVRFLIVGAYALALHGRPRATGDLDLWVDPTSDNAPRIMKALRDFGAPLADVSESDFAAPGVVYQIGVPPGRIDILTELTGITFADAWPERLLKPFGEVTVPFIGRTAFLRNKRATGRPKDLGDIEGM